MSRFKLLSTGMIVMVFQAVACAAETESAAEEPGLFSGGLWTSFWTLVVFLVLLFVLSKAAWKPLLAALKKREDRIRDDITSAKQQREESEKTLEDLKRQLAEADAKARELMSQTQAESERIREQILAQTQADAAETLKDARLQLEHAKRQAMKELYAETVALAGQLAGKILQREVNAEDHRLLIEQGLKELDVNDSKNAN
jgi:F-type H+-transporting ATPase subunit b